MGPDEPAGSGDTSGGGTTSTLLAVLGVLVLVLALQCGWFVWNAARDVEVAATPTASEEKSDDEAPIEVPDGKPVVLGQLAVQEGVEAAAAAAQAMFARNWKSYDEGVDTAVALMTEDFGKEFRATTEDVRQEFVRKKTEVQVRVVAQSVVRANDAELEALIFLNQYVFRGEGDDAKSTYTPYRALLTMVHTNQGWLVDGVATK
jgi:Mce-associated membrane protein